MAEHEIQTAIATFLGFNDPNTADLLSAQWLKLPGVTPEKLCNLLVMMRDNCENSRDDKVKREWDIRHYALMAFLRSRYMHLYRKIVLKLE